MGDRYMVDERSGIIAVRDRTLMVQGYPGLSDSLPDVVQAWHGTQVQETCSECGHSAIAGWTVSRDDVQAAYELCKRMNEAEENDGK